MYGDFQNRWMIVIGASPSTMYTIVNSQSKPTG